MSNFFDKVLAKKVVKFRILLIIINIFGFLLIYPFIFIARFLSKNKKPKKIAIMRPDNIGDLVMISPMFEPIKKAYPNSELYVICQTKTKKLLESNDNIKISEFNPFWLSRSNHSFKGTIKYIISNFRKYDLLFEVRGDPICEFFSFFLAKKRIGFYDWGGSFFLNKSYGWKDNEHRVQNNLMLLSSIMPEEDYIDSEQRLPVTKSEYVDSFFKDNNNRIVLHPYAGQKQRDLPDQLIKDLIDKLLAKKDIQIYITGSENDSKRVDLLLKDFRINDNNVINLCGKLDLQQLPYFVSKCDLIICPDTSMAHIAATFKKPQVCLYGQKKQKTFYPYKNPNSLVLLSENECKYMKKGRCTKSDCEVHMKDFNAKMIMDAIGGVYPEWKKLED